MSFVNILLIFIILLIIFYDSIKIKNIEKFNDNIVIVSDNYNNFEDTNINISALFFDYLLKSILKNNNAPNILLNNTDKKLLKIYLDPYVLKYILKININDFKYVDKFGYFINVGYKDATCSWNLENKKIAYTCMTDFYFIMSIIKGYRLDESKIKLIKITSFDIENKKLFIENNIDLLITYVIENTKYYDIIKNTTYNIFGFKDIDFDRLRLFYPFIENNKDNLTNIFNIKNTVATIINEEVEIPKMKYRYLDNIPIVNETFKIEGFISRLEYSGDSRDPLYGCYGDTKNQNKASCNSKYDINGEYKLYQTIWDKKCQKDEDCPFYDARYENGKCVDNSCEMPVGVKKLGFTKYNDKGMFAPFEYSDGDYAFKDDFYKRSLRNKDTVISIIKYIY